MPTLKLTVFDPIEVILGEKTYKIESLSSRMLGDFQKAVEEYGAAPGQGKAEQLGRMLERMLPGMTAEEAQEVDIRHIVKIAEFLAEQITDAAKPGKVKN